MTLLLCEVSQTHESTTIHQRTRPGTNLEKEMAGNWNDNKIKKSLDHCDTISQHTGDEV